MNHGLTVRNNRLCVNGQPLQSREEAIFSIYLEREGEFLSNEYLINEVSKRMREGGSIFHVGDNYEIDYASLLVWRYRLKGKLKETPYQLQTDLYRSRYARYKLVVDLPLMG